MNGWFSQQVVIRCTNPHNTYSLGLAHAPQLDKAVVTGGHDQGHSGVEGNPVHTAVVALENELDNGVGIAEHVGLVGIGASNLVLEGHGRGRGVLLAEARDCDKTKWSAIHAFRRYPCHLSRPRHHVLSQTRTVWSREAETIRSSLGWNWAHMT